MQSFIHGINKLFLIIIKSCFLMCVIFVRHVNAQEGLSSCTIEQTERVEIDAINLDATLKLNDGRIVKLASIDDTSSHYNVLLVELLKKLTVNAEINLSKIHIKNRWGQLEAHVFIKPYERNESAWLQGFLLEFGHARLSVAHINPLCLAQMQSLETQAQISRIGLWTDSNAILKSDNTQELMSKRGEMVYIEGKVLSIGETRGVFYLNFGRSWTKDLTAIILRRKSQEFEQKGLNISALVLKTILIKGIVEGVEGPRLDIKSPDQIRILD